MHCHLSQHLALQRKAVILNYIYLSYLSKLTKYTNNNNSMSIILIYVTLNKKDEPNSCGA